MSVELIGWHDEHSLDHRRRLRNAMLVSFALHGSIFAAFAVAPTRTFEPMPDVISVELIAAPSAGQRASRPPPSPPSAPAPETPSPEPAPPPEPPVTKAPVQVLPEESPGRIRKVKPPPPKPKAVAKVQPKPAPARPKREKALSYEDTMAELGLDETEEFLNSLKASREVEDSAGQPEAPSASDVSRAGAAVSPELAAWNLATQRRIQSKWVTPASFRGRGLSTRLELRLSASGELIGTPEVVGTSGDPYFDDNAVRALLTAAPLPPPPKAGPRSFLFRSEAN